MWLMAEIFFCCLLMCGIVEFNVITMQLFLLIFRQPVFRFRRL